MLFEMGSGQWELTKVTESLLGQRWGVAPLR